jgi:hypothetical protein
VDLQLSTWPITRFGSRTYFYITGATNTLKTFGFLIFQISCSATSTAITHYGNIHCVVHNQGDVLWVPPSQFSVLCSLNLKYWPFDTQHCEMIFGSWTYAGDQIDIDLIENKTKVKRPPEPSFQ